MFQNRGFLPGVHARNKIHGSWSTGGASRASKGANSEYRNQASGKLDLTGVAQILEEDAWHDVLAYDAFRIETVALHATPWGMTGRWTDHDDLELLTSLQKANCSVSLRTVKQAVELVARRNSFHPVKSYLDHLHWDGQARMELGSAVIWARKIILMSGPWDSAG